MESVLFLLRDNPMTGRRYVLVAQQLQTMDIQSHCVLFTDSQILGMIFKELGIADSPFASVISYCRMTFLEKAMLLLVKMLSTLRSVSFRLIPQWNFESDKRAPSVSNVCNHELLQDWGKHFKTEEIVRSFYDTSIDQWNFDTKRASKLLGRITPSAVVYDIEVAFSFLPVLSVAHDRSIPVISMQHVEGFGKQYSAIPRLADFYIAYSHYNVENLKNMGVDSSHIFLTGVPDTDIIYNYDKDAIRNRLQNELQLSSDKKTILIALRPNYYKSYVALNDQLVEHVKTVFNNDKDFQVIIKPHCHEPGVASDFQQRFSVPDSQNIVVVDREYPLSQLLLLSNYLITFMSSSIVESVMMNVPTIVIDIHEKGNWPPWNTFNTYQTVEFDEIRLVLQKIKENEYLFDVSEMERQRFIEYFRFKYDNQASRRIAEALDSVIT